MASGRTPLFRQLGLALQRADWLNRHPRERRLFGELRQGLNLERRGFLKYLGLAGAAALAGGLGDDAQAKPMRQWRASGGGPVAIIGGGTAGLTAAYRLHRAGLACELFEASDRFGGRMYTKYDFNAEGMFCELGGELVDSNHADLIGLAGELGVGIQELKGVDSGFDLYFFGGRHYTDEQLIPLFQPLARRIAADAQGLWDDADQATEKARRLDTMSLEQYLDASRAEVERWVLDAIRVAYVGEYGRDAAEQSALNLVTFIDPDTSGGFRLFGDSDESKRIQGGNSSLPNAIVKALEGKVPMHRGLELTRISSRGSGLALTFQRDHGASRTVTFDRVVCAIPFTMLRGVDGIRSLGLSEGKRAAIAQLGYGTNVKVMYGFKERWWRNPAVALPTASNGAMLSDLPFQLVWECSRGQPGSSGILTNFIGGSEGASFQPARFEKFREEIALAFPGIGDKFDSNRAFMNWPKHRYTRGSYTCPLVGQYTTLLDVAGTPELDGTLVFAGEHTSGEFSGFMNGAVQSGNRAAQDILRGTTARARAA